MAAAAHDTLTNTGRPTLAARGLYFGYSVLGWPGRQSFAARVGIGGAAYALILIVLVALGINGSSMGMFYGQFFAGNDPQLLQGVPRPIRSDEWLVVSPLTIAQVEQGLPRINTVFPGGLDTSLIWDLPYREWSAILRPHTWGFYFLPLDSAFAFKWWFPFIVMTAVLYLFLCLLWRRALASFAVAGAFAASPFFQWWFGSGSFWPPACAIAACGATILMLRSDRTWLRWMLGAAVAYLVAVAVVALYPPYLIPCIYPALGFCAGWFFTRSATTVPWRVRLRRLVPLGAAVLAVVGVFALFLMTRSESVDAVMSTVYPGHRLSAPGSSAGFGLYMYAGVFGEGLRSSDLTGFAPNASEASSFIFLGLYLLPSAAWLAWSRWRRRRGVDWAIVGTSTGLALLFAFIYLPGWGAIAHLLFLDRTALPRIVIGIGVGSILLLGLIVQRLRELESLPPWWCTWAAVGVVLLNHAVLYRLLSQNAPATLAASVGWPALVIALAIAVGLFSRGRLTVPSVLVAIVALVVGGMVNPLYKGVLDLRSTAIGREIERTNESAPGTWVSVSGIGSTAVLRETGVEALSGVQAWPSRQMWAEIDPDGSSESIWNRYAHVDWTTDAAAPAISLVQTDLVQVRLDSCNSVAQKNIDYVLSDKVVDQPCLELEGSAPGGDRTYYIYRVQKVGPGGDPAP